MPIQQGLDNWYWGAKCPECGEISVHAHDPTPGRDDSKVMKVNQGEARVAMACPNGHRFDAPTESLLPFERSAQ
jgi:hypothetical protein